MTSKVTSIEDARLKKNLLAVRDILDKADQQEPWCWECKCGSDSFWILTDGYQCQHCDKIHSFESVHGSI